MPSQGQGPTAGVKDSNYGAVKGADLSYTVCCYLGILFNAKCITVDAANLVVSGPIVYGGWSCYSITD